MKKEILKFLVLAALAIGAGPASSAVWQWSRTATNNATADSSINWAEGMSPSSVNDSARSMMARLADYRDDISGSIYTTGGATAYVLATHEVFDTLAHMDGAKVAFMINVTNAASPTLAVDGLAARPINTASGSPAPAGTLIANTPYVATYVDAASEFRLQGFYGSPYSVPLGGLLPYTGTTAPNSSFILPAGQCISTTTYATYWALMGSPAPGACAGGQFVVVDLRGRTLSALDNLNGTAANRLTSSATGCGTAMTSVGTICSNGNESHTLTIAELASHGHTGVTDANNVSHTHTGAFSSVGAIGDGSHPNSSYGYGTSPAGNTGVDSTTHVHAFTTNGSGSSAAHPIVQPTMAVTYLLRVI